MVLIRPTLFVALIATSAACGGSGTSDVFVEVATDMLPEIEFESIRTTVIETDVSVDGDGEQVFDSDEDMDFVTASESRA